MKRKEEEKKERIRKREKWKGTEWDIQYNSRMGTLRRATVPGGVEDQVDRDWNYETQK